MKKVLYFMAIAAAAMFALSCNKDNGDPKKDGQEEDTYTGPYYRVKTFKSWTFTYGTDGKVTKAAYKGTYKNDQQEDVSYTDEYIFDYTVSPVTVKKEGTLKFEITFGANGFATTIADKSSNKTYTYTYDNDGYLATAKIDGELSTEISVENGCLQYWTRKNGDSWRYKRHTYYTDKRNIGNVHTSCPEGGEIGVDRWMCECGLVGKADKYVVREAKWNDRDASAVYDTNEYDENGCLIKESKVYNNGDPEVINFTFELIPGTQK